MSVSWYTVVLHHWVKPFIVCFVRGWLDQMLPLFPAQKLPWTG